MSSNMAHSQNTVRLTYEIEMSPDRVEAVMGAVVDVATSAEAAIELVEVTPNHSEVSDKPVDPETRRREVRGSIVQYVLDRVDDSNTLSGINILRRIRYDLGLKPKEGIRAMYDLTGEGIFTLRKRNRLTDQPEAVTVYPHTIQGAVDSGFLILPPKEDSPTEQPAPQLEQVDETHSPAPDSSQPRQEVPTPTAAVAPQRDEEEQPLVEQPVPQPEQVHEAQPPTPVVAAEPSHETPAPAVPEESTHQPRHERPERRSDARVQPTTEPKEAADSTDGRVKKNAEFSGDATTYSLTTVEVAALSDEAFLQLALTTRIFRRGFNTSGALKEAISEATGFEEERREQVIVSLLRQRLAVHSKNKGYRLKPTEEGEQYLKQQIASVKS